MLFLDLYFVAVLFSIATVWAKTITEDTIDRGAVAIDADETIIVDGVYWSLVDNDYTNFAGNVDVGEGSGFYISNTSPSSMYVAILSGSFVNDGITSWNAIEAINAPTFNIDGFNFINNGEVYMSADGSTGNPSMGITTTNFDNNGLLVFYQNYRTGNSVELGDDLLTINNNGQICLHNKLYAQRTSIAGTGCISAVDDSSIFIQYSALDIDTNQVFHLQDSNSNLRAAAAITPKTYTVAGFGNGNKIGLDFALQTLNPWTYDPVSGILTLRSTLLSQRFNIGTGYDPALFSITTESGLGLSTVTRGALTYSGPPPNAIPEVCQPCPVPPEAPGMDPIEYTTTIVTTNPDGSICTEVADVLVSTDADHIWYTTTNSVQTDCLAATIYTTTFTT
ncbi:hyphally regulated cell wall protein Exo-alpha-sialidase, partial [Scheffersomyces stipitis CBS 6054]